MALPPRRRSGFLPNLLNAMAGRRPQSPRTRMPIRQPAQQRRVQSQKPAVRRQQPTQAPSQRNPEFKIVRTKSGQRYKIPFAMTREQFKEALKQFKKAGKQLRRGRRRRRRGEEREEVIEEYFPGIPLIETRIEHQELRELQVELESVARMKMTMEEFIQRVENPELQAILASDEALNEFIKRLPDSKAKDLLYRLKEILTIQDEERRNFYRAAIIIDFLYRQ